MRLYYLWSSDVNNLLILPILLLLPCAAFICTCTSVLPIHVHMHMYRTLDHCVFVYTLCARNVGLFYFLG